MTENGKTERPEGPEKHPHDVHQAVSVGGVRYHQGERVDLAKDQGEAFGSRFVTPSKGAFSAPQNKALTERETR